MGMTDSRGRGLHVVLRVAGGTSLVLGVPAPLRIAHALVDQGIERFIFVTDSIPTFARAWKGQLKSLPWTSISATEGSLASRVDHRSPMLVLAPDGMPHPDDLRTFIAEARARATSTAWVWSGRTVAMYCPAAHQLVTAVPEVSVDFPTSALSQPVANRLVALSRSWYDLTDAKDVQRAERDLLLSLRKDTDGYLARVDRRLSIALSRALHRTPVTPNIVTAASLVVGLAGAGLLATPRYGTALLGALLLWTTCILDGCDGEIARLKLLATASGARFDVIADTIVHIAVFVALPINVYLTHPGLAAIPAGLVLLSGVLLSMAFVWWLLLRSPAPRRGAVELFYERVASRDFIYVILVLAVVRRLDWFLWTAAVGSHLFWLSLCVLAWRRR
jgi:phosphatidylglycerophosphate synthase